MNENKIILDLCGGTGAWSKPYKEAGYDVQVITLPAQDIKKAYFDKDYLIFPGGGNLSFNRNGHVTEISKVVRIKIKDIYGILAAPPCTMFSLARTTAKIPRDLDQGLEVVEACMRLIWRLKPVFWAMENPKGLLRKFMGRPAFEFDASEFGEDYNKHTDLWGYFKEPKKGRNYIRYPSTDKNTRKLPVLPENYVRDQNMSLVAMKRSITPAGFAKAFYKSNHA